MVFADYIFILSLLYGYDDSGSLKDKAITDQSPE